MEAGERNTRSCFSPFGFENWLTDVTSRVRATRAADADASLVAARAFRYAAPCNAIRETQSEVTAMFPGMQDPHTRTHTLQMRNECTRLSNRAERARRRFRRTERPESMLLQPWWLSLSLSLPHLSFSLSVSLSLFSCLSLFLFVRPSFCLYFSLIQHYIFLLYRVSPAQLMLQGFDLCVYS